MPTITKAEAKAYNLEDATDLATFGKQLHETCRGFYKPIHDRHQRAWDFYIGKQWRVYRRRGLAMVVFNIVGPHMDIIAANLTDSQIVFQVIPMTKEPPTNELSEIWSEVLRQACEQDRFTVQMYGALLDSLVKGYAVFKVTHDTDRMIPTRIEVIDPYNYMGEPGVRRPDLDGNYHWHSEWMTALQVRDMFPKKWQKLTYAPAGHESDEDAYEIINERGGDMDYTHMVLIHELYLRTDALEPIPDDVTEDELNSEHEEFQRIKPPRVILEQDHPVHIPAHQAQVVEIENKLREMARQMAQQGKAVSQETGQPMSEEELEAAIQQAIAANPIIKFINKHNKEHDEMLEDNPDGKRLKYNGWRRVVFGGPNFLVLDDDETPYTDEEGRGTHPFCIMTTQDTATDIYQWSVLERCMSLQEMVNLWMSRFTDYLGLFATPYVVINVDAITIDTNQIVPIAGAIVPVQGNPSEVFQWVVPPPLSNEIIKGFYVNVKHIETITGVSDVEMGAYPPMERASEPMLQQLKQAGRARWREYQRELEDVLQRIGKKLMPVIQKYMTEQMQMRVGGLENNFKVLNEEIEDKDGNLTFLNDMSAGRYDVRIRLTPLTMLTPEAKLQRAMQLYTAANPVTGITIYDLEAVAEDTEDATVRKSVDRQKEKQAQAEQMQQQEAAGKQQTRGAE